MYACIHKCFYFLMELFTCVFSYHLCYFSLSRFILLSKVMWWPPRTFWQKNWLRKQLSNRLINCLLCNSLSLTFFFHSLHLQWLRMLNYLFIVVKMIMQATGYQLVNWFAWYPFGSFFSFLVAFTVTLFKCCLWFFYSGMYNIFKWFCFFINSKFEN